MYFFFLNLNKFSFHKITFLIKSIQTITIKYSNQNQLNNSKSEEYLTKIPIYPIYYIKTSLISKSSGIIFHTTPKTIQYSLYQT